MGKGINHKGTEKGGLATKSTKNTKGGRRKLGVFVQHPAQGAPGCFTSLPRRDRGCAIYALARFVWFKTELGPEK